MALELLNDNQLIVIFRSDSNTKLENFLFSSYIAEVLLKSSHFFAVAPFPSSQIATCVDTLTGKIVDSHGRLKTHFPDFRRI